MAYHKNYCKMIIDFLTKLQEGLLDTEDILWLAGENFEWRDENYNEDIVREIINSSEEQLKNKDGRYFFYSDDFEAEICLENNDYIMIVSRPYFEYQPKFLENPEEMFENLMKEIPFEQRTVKVFGKEHNEPRLTSVHGDESVRHLKYVYSKSPRKLSEMTPTLHELQQKIEEYTGIHFDFVLLNLYRDGNDKVGWHSDDEKMMNCSHIVSISLGSERKFKLRNKKDKNVSEIRLEDGSMIWMKPGCQDELEHEVPKELRVKEPRINLTFRRFLKEK